MKDCRNKPLVPAVTVLLFLFAGITFFVYKNHFHNAFHFDDFHTIVNNLSIRNLDNLPRFFTDGTTFSSLPSNQSYRPMVTMLNAIDYHFTGGTLNSLPFHISIFISFLLLGWCMYGIVLYILRLTADSPYNRWIAVFITAWFWLHAANAETINYIISRTDSFSTFMVAVAFICYFYWPAARRYYLYMIPVLIGFLAKEPAILFIPLLFLFKLFFEENLSIAETLRRPQTWWKTGKQLFIPILLAIMIVFVYKVMTPDTWQAGGFDRGKYMATQPFVIMHYFSNFFVPSDLVIDSDWTIISTYNDFRVFTGLFFLVALMVVAVYASRRLAWRPVTFGICWFLITLAPTSLIPFAEVLNDHRTFFPYIGLFIAAASAIRNGLQLLPATNIRRVALSLAVIAGVEILFLHAWSTRERNEVWHSEESIWQEATIKAPGNGRAWMNYGLSVMAKGNYPLAEECFTKTVSLWPAYSYAFINLGILKNATGDPGAAEQNFKKALSLNPGSPECYSYYAGFLLLYNRGEEAAVLVKKGLALSPSHPMLQQFREQLHRVGLM